MKERTPLPAVTTGYKFADEISKLPRVVGLGSDPTYQIGIDEGSSRLSRPLQCRQ